MVNKVSPNILISASTLHHSRQCPYKLVSSIIQWGIYSGQWLSWFGSPKPTIAVTHASLRPGVVRWSGGYKERDLTGVLLTRVLYCFYEKLSVLP